MTQVQTQHERQSDSLLPTLGNNNTERDAEEQQVVPTWCALFPLDEGSCIRLLNNRDYRQRGESNVPPKYYIGREGALPNNTSAVFDSGSPAVLNMAIDSPLISGIHCCISLVRKWPIITDYSANGVFVNNHRIPKEKSVKLYHGDIIQLVREKPSSSSSGTFQNQNSNHQYNNNSRNYNSAGSEKYVKSFMFIPLGEKGDQVCPAAFEERTSKIMSSAAGRPGFHSNKNNNNNNNNTNSHDEDSNLLPDEMIPSNVSPSKQNNVSNSNNNASNKTKMFHSYYSVVTSSTGQDNNNNSNNGNRNSNSSASHAPCITQYGYRLPDIGGGGRGKQLHEIGRGATSIVYVGLDGKTNEQIAVKDIFKPPSQQYESSMPRFDFHNRAKGAQAYSNYYNNNNNDSNSNNNKSSFDNATPTNDVDDDALLKTQHSGSCTSSSLTNISVPIPRQNTANADELVREEGNVRNPNDDDDCDKDLLVDDDTDTYDGESSKSDDDDDDDFAANFKAKNPERAQATKQRMQKEKQVRKRIQQVSIIGVNDEEQDDVDLCSPPNNSSQGTQVGKSKSNSPFHPQPLTDVPPPTPSSSFPSKKTRRQQNEGTAPAAATTATRTFDLAELNVLTKIYNKRIVGFYGWEELGDRYRLYLEYVPGGCLRENIVRYHGFSEHSTRLYTMQLLMALEYLHHQGVVHGDLKPANILVTTQGSIKVTDFGTSYFFNSYNPGSGSTSSQGSPQQIFGTPIYMSPEMCRGETGATFASDIWALGCIVYEMYTGLLPWKAEKPELDSPISIIWHIGHAGCCPSLKKLHEPPTRSPGNSQIPMNGNNNNNNGTNNFVRPSFWFEDFLYQCFELDPKKRPAASELLRHPFLVGEELTEGALERIRKMLSGGGSSSQSTVELARNYFSTLEENHKQQQAQNFVNECVSHNANGKSSTISPPKIINDWSGSNNNNNADHDLFKPPSSFSRNVDNNNQNPQNNSNNHILGKAEFEARYNGMCTINDTQSSSGSSGAKDAAARSNADVDHNQNQAEIARRMLLHHHQHQHQKLPPVQAINMIPSFHGGASQLGGVMSQPEERDRILRDQRVRQELDQHRNAVLEQNAVRIQKMNGSKSNQQQHGHDRHDEDCNDVGDREEEEILLNNLSEDKHRRVRRGRRDDNNNDNDGEDESRNDANRDSQDDANTSRQQHRSTIILSNSRIAGQELPAKRSNVNVPASSFSDPTMTTRSNPGSNPNLYPSSPAEFFQHNSNNNKNHNQNNSQQQQQQQSSGLTTIFDRFSIDEGDQSDKK